MLCWYNRKRLTLTDMPRHRLRRDPESEKVWRSDFIALRLRTLLASSIYALKDFGREYSLILPTSLLVIVMMPSSSSSRKEDGKIGVTGLFDDAVDIGDGGSLGGGGKIHARWAVEGARRGGASRCCWRRSCWMIKGRKGLYSSTPKDAGCSLWSIKTRLESSLQIVFILGDGREIGLRGLTNKASPFFLRN